MTLIRPATRSSWLINQQMAKLADAVVEVVCGIPLCLKGKELPV